MSEKKSTNSNLFDALSCYSLRKDRVIHPEGYFDSKKRWMPSDKEEQECCKSIRTPSGAWPFTKLNHCRSPEHIALKYGVSKKDLIKIYNVTHKAKAEDELTKKKRDELVTVIFKFEKNELEGLMCFKFLNRELLKFQIEKNNSKGRTVLFFLEGVEPLNCGGIPFHLDKYLFSDEVINETLDIPPHWAFSIKVKNVKRGDATKAGLVIMEDLAKKLNDEIEDYRVLRLKAKRKIEGLKKELVEIGARKRKEKYDGMLD